MRLAILRYHAGNVQSVQFAFERLGISAEITDDHEALRSADKVIFPGVGEASTAMNYLRERKLDQLIRELKQPVLGICLGMQLLCRRSEEGDTDAIGVFNQPVLKFDVPLKTPQVGWNTVASLRGSLFNGLEENSYFYFVHGFYVPLCDDTIAQTGYSVTYSAALQKNNFYACQFHPEKSSAAGEQLLRNFLAL